MLLLEGESPTQVSLSTVEQPLPSAPCHPLDTLWPSRVPRKAPKETLVSKVKLHLLHDATVAGEANTGMNQTKADLCLPQCR